MSNNNFIQTPGEFSGHPVHGTYSIAIRRHSLIGTGLSLPVSPQAGEGLPELFFRGFSRNGYKNANQIWKLISSEYKTWFQARNFVDLSADDESLANLLGTPNGASDIEPLRYINQGKGVIKFFGTTLKMGRLSNWKRVSPRFLRSHGYMKAIWSVVPISFDPSNFEYLLDHCPVCGAKLSNSKALGLYNCHRCVDAENPVRGTTDLRDHPRPIVEIESYENLSFYCSLMDPALEQHRSTPADLHVELRSFTRGEIFEFITIIACLLDLSNGASSLISCSPWAIDRATAAVRNWPQGLFNVAAEVAVTKKYTVKRRPFRNAVLEAVMTNRYLFSSDFLLMLRNQARAGTSPRDLSKIDDSSQHRHVLQDYRTWKPNGFDITSAQDRVVYASALTDNSKPMIAEITKTGLPRIELINLYESGQISCPDEKIKALFPHSDADDLLTALKSVARTSREDGYSLFEVVSAERSGVISWSRILKRILDGTLPISLDDSTERLIRRIRVHDMALVNQIIVKGVTGKMVDRVVLSNRELGFYVGDGTCMSALISSGLLRSDRTFEAARRFREEFVTGVEVMRFLKIHKHPIQSSPSIFKSLAKAGIKPIHTHPWVHPRLPVIEWLTSKGY